MVLIAVIIYIYIYIFLFSFLSLSFRFLLEAFFTEEFFSLIKQGPFLHSSKSRISCASNCRAAAAVAPMQLNLETRVDCVHYIASVLRLDVYRTGNAMMNAWQRAVAKSVLWTYLCLSVTDFIRERNNSYVRRLHRYTARKIRSDWRLIATIGFS